MCTATHTFANEAGVAQTVPLPCALDTLGLRLGWPGRFPWTGQDTCFTIRTPRGTSAARAAVIPQNVKPFPKPPAWEPRKKHAFQDRRHDAIRGGTATVAEKLQTGLVNFAW